MPLKEAVGFGLDMVKLKVELALTAMDDGEKTFDIFGGFAL